MIGDLLEDVHAGLTAVLAAGHPLYLNEVKGVDLLMQLLSDLDVGHVVDLSPASGALAAAAAMKTSHTMVYASMACTSSDWGV